MMRCSACDASQGHAAAVSCVHLAPRIGVLVSGSADGTVRLWRYGSWECVGALKHEPLNLSATTASSSAAGSPSSAAALPAVRGGGALRLGVVGSSAGNAGGLATAAAAAATSSAAGGHSEGGVAGSRHGGKAIVATSSTTTPGGSGGNGGAVAVTALALARPGEELISGGDDGVARIWSCETGALLHRLVGHDGAVTAVRTSEPGGSSGNGAWSGRVVTASADHTVRLWDVRAPARRAQALLFKVVSPL